MQKTRNEQVYEEASLWVVDMHGGEMDAAARDRLDAWFRRSPEHIRAFLQLSCLWEELEEDLEDSGLDRESGIAAVVAQARASANVFPLEGDSIDPSRHGPGTLHRRVAHQCGVGILPLTRFFSWRSAVLASTALVCVGFGLVALNVYRHTHFSTGTGEQRIVRLTDGSTIELNAESRVRILFSERERDVDLVEGQALFKVAKDHARPFVVQSAGTRVRAVGTQFDVYRKASGTQVTVVEGRVAVFAPRPAKQGTEGEVPFSSTEAHFFREERLAPGQLRSDRSKGEAGSPAMFVSAGEQVTVSNLEVPQPRHADLRVATAWTQRKLVFEMTPLSEVVREFNRYNTRKLFISDPALAEFHVTGVFSSSDPTSLLQFLQAQRDIDVFDAGVEIRISKK